LLRRVEHPSLPFFLKLYNTPSTKTVLGVFFTITVFVLQCSPLGHLFYPQRFEKKRRTPGSAQYTVFPALGKHTRRFANRSSYDFS
jgi:hypothetical protein